MASHGSFSASANLSFMKNVIFLPQCGDIYRSNPAQDRPILKMKQSAL
jgi:hypothetical protein